MLFFCKLLISIFIAISFCYSNVFAQSPVKTDSIQEKTILVKKKNPKTATLLSLALPGAGQIYNGKYWKAPIAWAGLIFLASNAIIQNKSYETNKKKIEDLVVTTINGVKSFKSDPQSQNDLIKYSSFADTDRRNRDFSWLGFGALYIYQVIDACVDAHLSEFDMSENIGLNISPYLRHDLTNYQTGVAFTFKFKNKY